MRFIPLTEVMLDSDFGEKERVFPVNAEYIISFEEAYPHDKETYGFNSYVHIRSSTQYRICVKETVKTIWKMIHDWTEQDLRVRFHEMEKNL